MLASAENIARRGLPLPLGDHPVFHTDPARAGIGPAGDVTGSKDSGDVSLQKFVNNHAVVGRETCLFSKRGVRANADSNDHELAIQNRSVIELHVSVLDGCWCSSEVKLHAVLLVSLPNKLAQFASEDLFKRQRSLSND